MKKLKSIISLLVASIGLFLGLMTAGQVQAAVTYWDPQGSWPSGIYTGNMTGTWENKLWSTSSTGAGVSPTNWVEGTAACFGVGTGNGTPAFTVLMNANHFVNGMFIGSLNPNSCTVTVYGAGIMTITNLQGFNIHNASDGSLGILTISNTIADTSAVKGVFNPQNNGQIYLYGSNTWTGGTSLGYSGASWNGTVYFVTTNAFGTGNIYTSNCLGGALVYNGSSAITITNPLVFPTPTSATLYLVGGSSGVNFAGPVIVNQAVTLGIGSVNGPNLVTASGVMSGSGAITITNSTANTGTLALSGANTYSGNITIQSGTLALASSGSLSNAPTITADSAGIFDVSAYSPYAPGPKQTLNGFGTVNGDVLIENGAKISGGISTGIGTLTNSGSLLLQSGGTNIVYVQNALTGAGVGNSALNAANNIGVLANNSSPFTIKLDSITGTGAAGAVSNFDRTASYTWTIATAITGEVTNYDASDFVLDTSAFANLTVGGTFAVSNTGSALVLDYAPQTNIIITAQAPSNDLILYQGQYLPGPSVTAGGQGPLTYQWFTNGVADTTVGTNSSYPSSYVQQTVTYQCIVTNLYSAATDDLVTVTVLPWPSLYSSNLMTLAPAGYWPMHEVEAPAQGDIETNYGTLGVLGTGYYPDWAGNTLGIRRGVAGALADDTDTAVFFTAAANPSTAMYTNELAVPHVSPLSTLNPPFSVECWFYPTNTVSADVWAQNGYEGLNAGTAGGGNGKVSGVRLTWMNSTNTGFQIFTYNNSSTLLSPGFSGNIGGTQAAPIDNWYHVVLTCDASTNFSLYVNGALATLSATSSNGPGSYTPDYWTPLTIGTGRGGTRPIGGYVDEFAVYTNVLGNTAVSTHYNDGISGPAGQYFQDVTASNPPIYLRMDAAATYAAPAVATWPKMTNYGSAGVSGVYTPGTMPGVLTGPNNQGNSFVGFTNMDVALLSGVSSFADAGNSSAYNPTGSNANFSVSAIFRGNPCDSRVQSIVGHGTNSWELDMSTNGSLVFNAGNATNSSAYLTNQPASGSAAGDMKTIGVYNDGNWHQVVAVNQTNRVSIYVDGLLVTNGTPAGTSPTGVIRGITADVMIGSDPSFTNTPVGVGRQFAGQICDVAFYTNALTSSDVQALYALTGTTFTNLSPSLTVAYGTATATFSGTVNYSVGPAYPAQGETVTVAIPNVVTNSTTIDDSTGDFTVTVPINTVPAGIRVITYSYLGSTLAPATDISTTLTITKAPLTVTANAQAKTYGQLIPVGAGSTAFTDSGLQNSETIGSVTLAISGSPSGAVTNASVAGSPYTITPSAATGGTFNSANYSITYVTALLTVNPLPVGLTGTRLYDGTASAVFSILSITNKAVGTDIVNLASGSVTLASPGPGSVPIISASGLTLGGAQAGNYTTTGAIGAVNVTVNANPTNIVSTAANNSLTLSWPLDHTGWILQAQTNDVTVGLSNNWVDIAGSSTTNQVVVPVDPNNGTVFYRLYYTP